MMTHFGHWVEIPGRFKRGRSPAAQWIALPQLRHLQLVKLRVEDRLVEAGHKVVYGTLEAAQTVLEQTVDKVINTAFIQRMNLPLHDHLPALGRKVIKSAPNLRR